MARSPRKHREAVAGSGRICPEKGGAALVASLASGASLAAAARRAGCSERTARRRLEDPAFRAEVVAARGALVEEATGQLAGAATEAVRALRRLLKDRNGAVAVAAARSILSGVVALRQHAELAERVSGLERFVAAHKNGSTGPWRRALASQERLRATGGAE